MKGMSADLTILIPTWDRPEETNQRLREINSLFNQSVVVRIQVNPGRCSAADIDTSIFEGPIEINENDANIGFVANVIRGMLEVRTEWVWILGDDDSIKPEAPELIWEAIQTAGRGPTDVILFNQWHQSQSKSQVTCQDITSFMQATDFGDAIFISATIWRTSLFKSRVGPFVDYAYSWASQLLISITSLHEKCSSVLVVNSPLINYVYAHRWSRIDYLQRLLTLYRYPALGGHKKEFTNFIWPQLRWALESSAHGQVRCGEATLPEWLEAAFDVCRVQLAHGGIANGLGRVHTISAILFELYPIPRLINMVIRGVQRKVLGRKHPTPVPALQRNLGL